jgi:hypothetical protein
VENGCQSGCSSSSNSSNASTATWASLPSGAQTGIISGSSIFAFCLILLGLGSCWKCQRNRRKADLLDRVETGRRRRLTRTKRPMEAVITAGSLSEVTTIDEQDNTIQHARLPVALRGGSGERQEQITAESESPSREGQYGEIPEITIEDVDNTQEGHPRIAPVEYRHTRQIRDTNNQGERNNNLHGIVRVQNEGNPNLSVEEAFNLLDQAMIITQLEEETTMIDDNLDIANGDNRRTIAEETIIATDGVVDAANANRVTTIEAGVGKPPYGGPATAVEQTNDTITENPFEDNHEISAEGEEITSQHPESDIILREETFSTTPGQVITGQETVPAAQLENHTETAKVESDSIAGGMNGNTFNEQPHLKAEPLSSRKAESYATLPDPRAAIIGHGENSTTGALRCAEIQGASNPDDYRENHNDSMKVLLCTKTDGLTPTSVGYLNRMSLKELRGRPQETATDRLRELWLQNSPATDHVDPSTLCVRCARWRTYQLRICNHRPSLCLDCITTAVRASLGWLEVRCPDADCGVHLNPSVVGRFVRGHEYEQWVFECALACFDY